MLAILVARLAEDFTIMLVKNEYGCWAVSPNVIVNNEEKKNRTESTFYR